MYRSVLTELVPPADIALVSSDDVKDELGITDSSTDARIQRWIREASASIETYVGRGLRSRSVQETFHLVDPRCHYDTRSARALSLSIYPVTAIASVVECDGTPLVDGTDFELDGRSGLLWRLNLCRVGWGARRIVIQYTGGWLATEDVPPNVAAACTTMISYRRSAHGRDPALRQVSIPGVMDRTYYSGSAVGGSTGANGLPAEVASAVDYLRDAHA